MRLIDADKLKRDVLGWEDCYNGFSDTYDKAMIIGEIEEQPTIDAEPIRHGKWIKVGDNTYRCSRCNEVSCCNGNFCTDCGARMYKE